MAGFEIAEPIKPEKTRAIRRKLLAWYRRHQRQLPWRATKNQTPNPYFVLVSEAMLQQTQVATVIDYFERFIKAFATVEALAAANEQEVLKLWQGLGYYRRARNLHKAAQLIVSEHGGEVPRTVEVIATLPGVGRYTAGAIASIAYSQPAPILDGNVARVLARWFAIEACIDDTATKNELWRLAAELVPKTKPGDFNQAMMELGAMVCSPRGPACLTCPVRSECDANEQGVAESLPVRQKKVAQKVVQHHVLAIKRRGKYLFSQRPANGLWANMWELPTFEDMDAVPKERDVAKRIKLQTGLQLASLNKVNSMQHQTTHRKIQFTLWQTSVESGRLKSGVGSWRFLDDVDDLPLAKPQVWAVGVLNSLDS